MTDPWQEFTNQPCKMQTIAILGLSLGCAHGCKFEMFSLCQPLFKNKERLIDGIEYVAKMRQKKAKNDLQAFA